MLFGIEMEVTYRCVESEARKCSLVITPSRGVFASYHPTAASNPHPNASPNPNPNAGPNPDANPSANANPNPNADPNPDRDQAEEPYTVRESLRNLKCNINDKTAHLYR